MPETHNPTPNKAFHYFSEKRDYDDAARLISFVYTYALDYDGNVMKTIFEEIKQNYDSEKGNQFRDSERYNQYYDTEEKNHNFRSKMAKDLRHSWICTPTFVIRCIYTIKYLHENKNYYPYSYCLTHPDVSFNPEDFNNINDSNFQEDEKTDGIVFFKPKTEIESVDDSMNPDNSDSHTGGTTVASVSAISSRNAEVDPSNLTKKLSRHLSVSDNSIFSKLILCSEFTETSDHYKYFMSRFLPSVSLFSSQADAMSIKVFKEKSKKSNNRGDTAVRFINKLIKNYFWILDKTCRTDDFINNALCFYKLESTLGIMSFCAYLENNHESIPHKIDLFDKAFLQLNTNTDVYSCTRYNLPISDQESTDNYPDYTDIYKYIFALMHKLSGENINDIYGELKRTACLHYDLFSIGQSGYDYKFFSFKELSRQYPRRDDADIYYIRVILYNIRKGNLGEKYQRNITSILEILDRTQKNQLADYIIKRYSI